MNLVILTWIVNDTDKLRLAKCEEKLPNRDVKKLYFKTILPKKTSYLKSLQLYVFYI